MLDVFERRVSPVETDQTRSTNGILLVHGITGVPTEMRPLARYLELQGYRVAVPLLPGHGSGHRTLLATTRHDWLNGVRRAFHELVAACDQVLLVGLCGGGLLNIFVAAEDRRVAGLVVLSPDVGFSAPGPATPWTRMLFPLARRVPLLKRYGYWTERPPYGLKDPRLQRLVTRSIAASQRGQTSEYGTFRTYVGTIHEMKCLHEDVRHRVGDVTCPTLIMHSFEDSLFTIRNATTLYGLLGSRDKTLELVTGCDHVMTVDLRKDHVAKRIGTFAERIMGRRVSDREPLHVR